MMTIVIFILATVAAIFAALFISERNEKTRYEAKSDELSSELMQLRAELARVNAMGSGRQSLSKELIQNFIRDEEGYECQTYDDRDLIIFNTGDGSYHVDTERLPHQVLLRKGYNLDGADVDWVAMEKASIDVMKGLVIVKININRELNSFEYCIVSLDRTIGNFARNFAFYMGLLNDAERLFGDKYREYAEDKGWECDNVMAEDVLKYQMDSQKLKS